MTNINAGIILQTRLTSHRFPNKAICPLLGKTVTEWVIDALLKTNLPIVVAMPNNLTDKGLAVWINTMYPDIPIRYGFTEDVLWRFQQINKEFKFDPIIRVCGDAPFTSPEDITLALDIFKARNFYTRVNGIEVFSKDELQYGNDNCSHIKDRENVISTFAPATVDYPEDIKRIEKEWRKGSPTMDGRKELWHINQKTK